mmetsp:Transcript_9160/g.20203  ORF Transcript_9160/g.20203 Transcript_9160/m.20203 type:complete len:777 (+) Transcript_9160:82-2412(+)
MAAAHLSSPARDTEASGQGERRRMSVQFELPAETEEAATRDASPSSCGDNTDLSDISDPLLFNHPASLTSTTASPFESKGEHGSAGDLSGTPDEEGVNLLCVGVMRTGLKTLHKALRNLGYANIYDQEDIVSTYELWDDVLRNKSTKEAFSKLFGNSTVVMGMPTFCFWESILDLYPNARVILTIRDEDEWWESVHRAKTMMDQDLPGAPLRHGSVMRHLERFLVPSYHKFCEVLRFAWNTTLGAHALEGTDLNEVSARGSYRRHNSYVMSRLGKRRTAQGKPQLLVYDVREGWKPLCKFLGKDMPEVEFPSVMHVPYFPDATEELAMSATASDVGQEFEDFFVPDSDFGIRMRKEMRRGLVTCLAVLTLLVGLVFAVHATLLRVPITMVALVYVAIVTVGWNAYAVMHGLVMRVPALVVLPMAMKSLFFAAALHVCFVSYGILKEWLVVEDQIASPLLVLSSRFMSIVCAGAAVYHTEHELNFGAPLQEMVGFALTHEASTWAGYEMLKYVPFPVQVMAKSLKMLPNMLIGRLLNGTRYSMYQYVQAICALVCVAIMHFTDVQYIDSREDIFNSKLCKGVCFLVLFFACDSFTAQWQTGLYKEHPRLTQAQMMLGGNLIGLIVTSGTFVASWSEISTSLVRAMEHPEVMKRIIALGIVAAMGQFCIYSAIRVLGPLSFTWIMTARQLLSVYISLIVFGHGVSALKIFCILLVFGIMSSKQLAHAVSKKLSLTCRMRSLSGDQKASLSTKAHRLLKRTFSMLAKQGSPGPERKKSE